MIYFISMSGVRVEIDRDYGCSVGVVCRFIYI